MIVKLLTEHHLEFLSLKGGCRASSESTLVKLLEISCPGSYNKVSRRKKHEKLPSMQELKIFVLPILTHISLSGKVSSLIF